MVVGLDEVASSPSGIELVVLLACCARELGLDLESRQYNSRLLALTSPKEYAAGRQV